MNIQSLPGLIIDVIKAAWYAATKVPRITCDVRSVFEAKWSHDFMPNGSGNTIAEGIEIFTSVTILLANNGLIDTALKDVHITVKRGKKVLGQLQHYLSRGNDKYTYIHGIVIEPHRIWGPETIHFRGSLWDISEPPEDLKAELIIQVAAQRPIRKKIKLHF